MPFKFNPFTDKLDIVETSAPGISNITTPDAVVVVPVAGNINFLNGAGMNITGAGNNVTFNSTGGGLTWQAINASQTLVIDHGYICVSPGGVLSLALPAVSPVGSVISIVLDGATSFTVTQAALQQIRIGASTTTLGAGGSLSSTAQGDSITFVCRTANLLWTVITSMGNPIII